VLAIEPCPPLASGPGRTVTGTFAHSAADVLDLEIEGLDTPLGCTANHPFWSADRQDFVPAGSLTIGEHLRTESGTLRQVTRITPRRGPPVPVFNLEVDAEHVYYVSTAGVLVHNAYPATQGTITTPSTKLQQWAQQGGYIDSRTNKWVKFNGNLAADHVYPKDLIKKLDGFDRLTPQQQEFLLNYPGNFEPLPKSWNSSKRNRLADDWAKTPMGRRASKEYLDGLRERQHAFEGFAKNLIDFWNR
jgi:hypothetical protein